MQCATKEFLCSTSYSFLLQVGKRMGRGETLAHAWITVVTRLRIKEARGDPSTRSANRHVPRLIVFEDNEAVIKIVIKRRSMALRHVLRTHRVSIDWCFEVFSDPDIHIRYVNTKEQIADMMTKGFSMGTFGSYDGAHLPNLSEAVLQHCCCVSPRFSRTRHRRSAPSWRATPVAPNWPTRVSFV